MASFAGDEEKQYPGFVRRASSGYDKYYPADKQIQLYTPKPAPFYGQTTAGDSYKKWEVQPKPRVDEDMAPPPTRGCLALGSRRFAIFRRTRPGRNTTARLEI